MNYLEVLLCQGDFILELLYRWCFDLSSKGRSEKEIKLRKVKDRATLIVII